MAFAVAPPPVPPPPSSGTPISSTSGSVRIPGHAIRRARELIVLGEDGRIVGFLDEAENTQIYHASTQPVNA